MKLIKFRTENVYLKKTDILDCIIDDILTPNEVIDTFDTITSSFLIEDVSTSLWKQLRMQY